MRSRRPAARGLATMFTVIAAAAAVAGCSPSTATAAPSSLGRPSPPASAVTRPSATESTAAAPAGSDAASATTATGIVVDPGLLGHLPATIGGVSLEPDAATAAEIGTDTNLATSIEAIAVAAAFGPPAPSDTATDYAVATVVRLRPGVFDDAWFRDWRDTFDAGVCGQAGGVAGHAEASIGGHQSFIGTCAGGVHTWHTHLPGSDVVVSIQGAGDGRFGEHIVEGLTE